MNIIDTRAGTRASPMQEVLRVTNPYSTSLEWKCEDVRAPCSSLHIHKTRQRENFPPPRRPVEFHLHFEHGNQPDGQTRCSHGNSDSVVGREFVLPCRAWARVRRLSQLSPGGSVHSSRTQRRWCQLRTEGDEV